MDNRQGNLARDLNAWAQTIAIALAGLWGAYTFIYLEIRRPAAAPINLSTRIAVREAGVQSGLNPTAAHSLLAVELEITANNPSSRTVYLLSNYWRASGYDVASRPASIDWVAMSNGEVATRSPSGAGEHYALVGSRFVASGNALPDRALRPNETVSRTYLFYVPADAYDMIDVETAIPTISEDGSAVIEWSMQPNGTVESRVYRIRNAGREELEATPGGTYRDDSINLQMATSRRQLSLWRSRTSD